MRLVFAAIVLLAASPCVAQVVVYPIDIPTECVPLAQREGRSLVLENRSQALAARARLYSYKRDELVDQCRAAVRRIEAAIKEMSK